MADDGSVVIEVEKEPELELDATPEKVVEVRTEPKTEIETPKIEGIEELRAQLEAARSSERTERDRRIGAETEVAQSRTRVASAHTEVIDSHLASVESAAQAEQAKLAAAKQAYKQALEAGDWNAVTEANEQIAGSKAILLRLDEGKADLEARKAAPPQREEPIQRQTQQGDPLENAIARLTPRTQAWLRKHPECVLDTAKNLEANAADSMAKAKGFIPDSDAYFDYCERFLGYKIDEAEPRTRTATPQTRTRPMAAAPVRNGSTQSNGDLGEGQVILTMEEQAVANDGTIEWNYDDPKGKFKKGDPIGNREYARRKYLMMKQGAYDRTPTGT